MKKALSILAAFILLPCIVSCGNPTTPDEIPVNEIPMYGSAPLTDQIKKLNEAFVKNIPKDVGGREAATKAAIKLAWQYFYNGDSQTAMKRFNQAWLLNPNNAEVFYGFGFLLSIQRNIDEAIPMYEKALKIDPNHPMALANLARCYVEKAYALYLSKRLEYPDAEVKNILKEALALYEKAARSATSDSELRLTDLDSDLIYIYYQWATALELNGEYAKAWDKIKLSRKHGGDRLIKPGFIEELSSFMPEPKAKYSK